MCRAQRWLGSCGILLFCLLLHGCAVSTPAPIEDRATTPAPGGRTYRVQPGDTLYSIAWRYGLDYPRLAAANNIPSPFTIYVGQRLELREADVARISEPRPAAARGRPEPAPAPASPQRSTAPPEKQPSQTSPSTGTVRPPRRTDAPTADAAVDTWRWPAAGAVVRDFSSTLHKGIDIAGDIGDPVVAVAAGRVVYAGTGIPGYGQLLIVRHNDRYLSAYGHNDRLIVGEGDNVSAGQRIATRGSSGTNSVKLHFEIRENGKPIDPAKLLPRR